MRSFTLQADLSKELRIKDFFTIFDTQTCIKEVFIKHKTN